MERRKRILDGSQRIIGFVTTDDHGNQKVFDEHNVILGYVDKTGTYDRKKFRVSFTSGPGLLLQKPDGDNRS